MGIIEILLLSTALAMDAFAVSVAMAIKLRHVDKGQAFRLASHFGFFQFMMPVIGWALGLSIKSWIENWDHWVAFVLLAFIGLNMIKESFSKGEDEEKKTGDPTRGASLYLLSIATSIDALAVGLSFSILGVSVWFPALCIGIICAFLTLVGLYLGKTLAKAKLVGKYAELAGGLVLLGIGVKILIEHGVFN